MVFEPILVPDFWMRVGVSVLCGFIVGLERQLRGKPAGIRTSTLVCLGSMTYVYLGVLIGGDAADPTRVLGQVVTGVGFLGAGVILAREGLVKGVTSASALWVLAAVGAAVGFEKYGVAVSISIVTVAVLIGVEYLETGYKAFRRGVHAPDFAEESSEPPEKKRFGRR